jgi:hypothetical protein
MFSGTRKHEKKGPQPIQFQALAPLLVEDNGKRGLVDFDFAVIFA